MKTLQNDLTTIEQSKRLLELGVPKNSANHYYGKEGKLHYIDGTIPCSLLWETGCTPCWSVGRLIELIRFCTKGIEIYLYDSERPNMVMCLVKCIEKNISKFDFSKLED